MENAWRLLMVLSNKKLPLIAFITFLFFTITSCEIPPYDAAPTETPMPTPTPVGPKVFVREGNEQGKIISDALLEMQSLGLKGEKVPFTKTDEGALHLKTGCGPGDWFYVWAEGYYIEREPCDGRESYSIILNEYQYVDDANYIWKSAVVCKECHNNQINNLTRINHTEYPDWELDNHSKAYSNQIFKSVYLGANGEPGFLQFDSTDFGNCGFCHTPAGLDAPQTEVDIKNLQQKPYPAALEGVTCDVCHKATNIKISNGGFPYPDHPGALSYQFLRPPDDTARFYTGPRIFADINGFGIEANGSAITYSPIFHDSQFCAPCHYSKFWDVEIYNSYGEWKSSVYSTGKKKDIKTCQDCHMSTAFERQIQCLGIKEDTKPETTHNMMIRIWENGRQNPCLVQDAAALDVKVKRLDDSDQIQVTVKVYNKYAGHKFPTDSPLRHLILFVEVKGKDGVSVSPISEISPTIPLWGGIGDPQNGYFAGQAGKIFANLLMEDETNISPTVAYWKKVVPAYANSDTRLLPPQDYKDNNLDYGAVTDTSEYFFPAPNGGGHVNVRLIYRYAPIEMVLSKGWIIDGLYPYTLLNGQSLDIDVATEQDIPF